MAVLRSMGLQTAWNELTADTKPPKPKPKPKKRKPEQPAAPTRAYPLRSRGGPLSKAKEQEETAAPMTVAEEPEAAVDDETVMQYICGEGLSRAR